MKASSTLGMAILAATLLANLATGAIVFQDDFTGSNGTPFDSAKWTVSGLGAGSSTATIQNNAGQLYANGDNYQRTWATSTTGANFLTLGQTVTYSGSLIKILGGYTEGNFGVNQAVSLSYSWGNGYNPEPAHSPTLNLSVAGTYVGSFVIDASNPNAFSIVLTPTTYTVTMPGVLSGPSSYTGTYSLTNYTGGGKWYLFNQSDAGTWSGGSSATFDSLTIEVVPEPAALSLLALGGLALLRRRRN